MSAQKNFKGVKPEDLSGHSFGPLLFMRNSGLLVVFQPDIMSNTWIIYFIAQYFNLNFHGWTWIYCKLGAKADSKSAERLKRNQPHVILLSEQYKTYPFADTYLLLLGYSFNRSAEERWNCTEGRRSSKRFQFIKWIRSLDPHRPRSDRKNTVSPNRTHLLIPIFFPLFSGMS